MGNKLYNWRHLFVEHKHVNVDVGTQAVFNYRPRSTHTIGTKEPSKIMYKPKEKKPWPFFRFFEPLHAAVKQGEPENPKNKPDTRKPIFNVRLMLRVHYLM